MSKLGQFAAAGAAVLCAFGAFGGELDATKFTHKAFITFRGYDGASTLTNDNASVLSVNSLRAHSSLIAHMYL